jgi:hypothetical protein
VGTISLLVQREMQFEVLAVPNSRSNAMNKTKKPFSSDLFCTRPWLIALLLATVTFVFFSPAIGYDFINYDDNLYVFENLHVKHGFCQDSILYAFRSVDGGMWMPVTWLSFFWDTEIYGTAPFGYHLTNLLLHSASVALLFLALHRMIRRILPALVVAGVFALHPQRLESVVWIAERKDVLSTFFWMLGLLAYIRYVEKPAGKRMFQVVMCLILGIMAKPMVVSFPVVLLILDFWPLQRFGNTIDAFRKNAWPLVREKIPMFILCVAAVVVTFWSQHSVGSLVTARGPWHLELLRWIENLWYYFSTFFAPSHLAIVHKVEPVNPWHAVMAAMILAGITAVVIWRARLWPEIAAGWFWFLATVAPVVLVRLGPVTVADRYNYLPSVGLALVAVTVLTKVVARLPQIRSAMVGIGAAWFFYCVLLTWADMPQWQNTFTVFENAYNNGGNFIACDQVASLLYSQQDFNDSLAACDRGLDDNPEFASLYNTRGGDYYMLGDSDKALADYSRAIALNPAFSQTYYNRALIYLQRKQMAEARADLKIFIDHGGQVDADTRRNLSL